MKQVYVRFTSLDDIIKFTKIVSKYSMDVDITKGNTMLDAKSFQGLCTIGLCTKLLCIIHSDTEESQELISNIQEYVC